MSETVGGFTCKGDVSQSKISVAVQEGGIVLITQQADNDSDHIVVLTSDYIPVFKALLDKAAREIHRTKGSGGL